MLIVSPHGVVQPLCIQYVLHQLGSSEQCHDEVSAGRGLELTTQYLLSNVVDDVVQEIVQRKVKEERL